MGNVGGDVGRAFFQQCVGSVDEGATGIDDVVDQNAGFAGRITDHVDDFGFTGPLAALVDDRKRSIDAGGELTRPHHAADVRRYHHDLAQIEVFAHVPHHYRRCKQIVGRNVEKDLDLADVAIGRQNAIEYGR